MLFIFAVIFALVAILFYFVVPKMFSEALTKTLKRISFTIAVLSFLFFIFSLIRLIPAGEVGVLHLFGKVQEQEIHSGFNLVNPLLGQQNFSIKTQEEQEVMEVPSKEGLSVSLDVSILYKIEPDGASEIYKTIGKEYVGVVLRPSFRSAARNVTVRFEAKDLYTAGRDIITKELVDDLQNSLSGRKIIIENVLLRSIQLPATVKTAIEDKLKAEQEAQKMEFILQKETQEAERKRIEAAGIQKANQIIAQGLTDNYLRWYRIEMLKLLVTSPNTTTIVLPEDLKTSPILIGK